jgi:hypothetical protein
VEMLDQDHPATQPSVPIQHYVEAEWTYHMIHHGDKKIEEQLSSILHLVLHRTASLECVTRTNDQCEIVRSQLGIIVGRVGVGVAGGCQNGAALDAGLETLFAKCEALEFGKGVLFGGALDQMSDE